MSPYCPVYFGISIHPDMNCAIPCSRSVSVLTEDGPCRAATCSNVHVHVQEGLGLIPVPCTLKMKLVPPSLPRSSYVSSSFWFIL